MAKMYFRCLKLGQTWIRPLEVLECLGWSPRHLRVPTQLPASLPGKQHLEAQGLRVQLPTYGVPDWCPGHRDYIWNEISG